MVPNISGNGRSFRGAGAYHLHDKPSDADPRPRTSARVAFTATRNLANEDPSAALDEMWRTAEDARHLKAWAGLAPSGRKSAAPVKTVSLAWAPGERPTREEMCAAADSFMKAMGWAEHQVIYVGHNDTRHVHLHLIINRVHPDNGRTLNDWQERKRAQKWAHAYEQQQGTVLCAARAAKLNRGAKHSPAGLPYREAKLLKDRDAPERKRIARQVQAAFRPAWAAHYRRQRTALESFDRRRHGVEHMAADLVRQGDSLDAMRALEAFADRRAELIRSFRRQRATLARSQHGALRTLLAANPPESAAPPTDNTRGAHEAAGDPAPRKHALSPEASRTRARPPPVSLRLAPAHLGPPRPSVARPSRTPLHRRLALNSAARELLPPPRAAPRHAAARARAEIAVQFAHRWAAIRRMPPEERAAAAAALHAEQAAALAARTKHLLGELQQEQRSEHARRRTFLAGRRVARREAWAAAASVVAARRLAPAPARPAIPARATPPPMSTRS